MISAGNHTQSTEAKEDDERTQGPDHHDSNGTQGYKQPSTSPMLIEAAQNAQHAEWIRYLINTKPWDHVCAYADEHCIPHSLVQLIGEKRFIKITLEGYLCMYMESQTKTTVFQQENKLVDRVARLMDRLDVNGASGIGSADTTGLEARVAVLERDISSRINEAVNQLEVNRTDQESLAGRVQGLADAQEGLTSLVAHCRQLFTGITDPSDWMPFMENGIMVTVDTSHCNFPPGSQPHYFTALDGSWEHWTTTGATSIYNATHNSFRVYIQGTDSVKATCQFAVQHGWKLKWVAFL
ncbi:Peptidase inhibitor I9 [Seminavis robusta]|uniref:Peptidase inhibitor I9 n=1 Tax=Seminavis robusta TaxID=568900 RepID=A0A9N8DFF9_9STRA|nr:Peptidase inhibitor I9 [Seminavis robusta]|eukprot:Sro99_g050890.1 Peptidase inhibitor I9 (296) ;mRNA; r:64038-64925